jgi:pimeloyl-ACP methyl ester carboxylesterase
VVVLNGIQDEQGNAIIKNPGLTAYGALSDPEAALLDPALAPVRALINGLWEPTAQAAFGLADDSTIALTYSFTTSGDEKVLNYIADPKQWFEDQINRFVGLTVVKSVIGYADLDADGNVVEGGEDYRPDGPNFNEALFGSNDIPKEVEDITALFPLFLSAEAQAALSGLEAIFPAVGCTGTEIGPAYISCLSKSLANKDFSPLGPLLPTPEAAIVDFTGATAVPHPEYGGLVSVKQGSMKIPYYAQPPLDIGTGANPGDNEGAGFPIKYLSWEADDTLATAINTTFASLGLVIPQADPDVTTAVNYIFPFPKQQDANVATPDVVDDLEIPIVAVYPTGAAGPMKTMFLGHGLGGSRAFAASATGAALVGQAKLLGVDLTVLAIDQPLHGLKSDFEVTVDPDSDTSTDNNVTTTVIAKTANERHFGYAEAGPGLPPRALTEEDNLSLLFVNVESFLTTRDNNRQNALDLLALRKAVGGIDLNGVSGAGTSLNGDDVYYQGYSLGTISAQAALAVANDTAQADTTDDFKSAFFSTPGGGIARFFESSPAFAGSIVDGLASQGLTSDTSSYQAYISTLQASLDAFDAINFVGDYEEQGLKVLYYTASNDQVIPVSQVPGRTLSAPAGVLGVTEIDASVSYLSGAEPLLIESNATAIEAAGPVVVDRNVIRFKPGAGSHGGPCPAIGEAGALEFGGYALGMLDLTGAGPAISVSATAESEYIDAAPIDDFFVDPNVDPEDINAGCTAVAP